MVDYELADDMYDLDMEREEDSVSSSETDSLQTEDEETVEVDETVIEGYQHQPAGDPLVHGEAEDFIPDLHWFFDRVARIGDNSW